MNESTRGDEKQLKKGTRVKFESYLTGDILYGRVTDYQSGKAEYSVEVDASPFQYSVPQHLVETAGEAAPKDPCIANWSLHGFHKFYNQDATKKMYTAIICCHGVAVIKVTNKGHGNIYTDINEKNKYLDDLYEDVEMWMSQYTVSTDDAIDKWLDWYLNYRPAGISATQYF